MKLLIATTNLGKVDELHDLLGDHGVELLSLQRFPNAREVDETGRTFIENAKLKAAGYADRAKVWTLADDSGLEVSALDGLPGVNSARFAGRDAGYDVKIAKLFEMMDASGNRDRSARFVCAMAIADPEGNIRFTTEGICDGSLSFEPKGTNGFGYDPIFVPAGHDRTFGELPAEVKRSLSHRAKAARSVVRYLLDLIAV